MGNTHTHTHTRHNQRSLLANHFKIENHDRHSNKPSWNELLGADIQHFIARILAEMDDQDTLRRAQHIQERVTHG